MTSDQITALLTRIYALLLRLYPQPFRRDYGDQMVQVFRDSCRDSVENRREILSLWLATLADLIVNAVAERLLQITSRQWIFAALRSLVGLVAFVASGVLLSYVSVIIAVLFLIPWDVGIPPSGTFAEAVNHFFDGNNSLIPAVIVIGCVIIAYARCLLSERGQIGSLSWRFTILNFAAMLLSALIAFAGFLVIRELSPDMQSLEGNQRWGTVLIYWGLIVLGGLIAFYAYQAWTAPAIIRIRLTRSRVQKQTRVVN